MQPHVHAPIPLVALAPGLSCVTRAFLASHASNDAGSAGNHTTLLAASTGRLASVGTVPVEHEFLLREEDVQLGLVGAGTAGAAYCSALGQPPCRRPRPWCLLAGNSVPAPHALQFASKPAHTASHPPTPDARIFCSLPPSHLLVQAFRGTGTRLKRVAAKLLAGQPVNIVFAGGSVTAGAGASPGKAYPHRFFKAVNRTWPSPAHKFVNGARHGTTSALYALCTSSLIPEVGRDACMHA